MTLPIPRDADHAAYIINRAIAAHDDAFLDEFLDAILTSSDNPAIDDIYAILCADSAIRDEILLSLEICPIHECDIEICADDDETECAHLR